MNNGEENLLMYNVLHPYIIKHWVGNVKDWYFKISRINNTSVCIEINIENYFFLVKKRHQKKLRAFVYGVLCTFGYIDTCFNKIIIKQKCIGK